MKVVLLKNIPNLGSAGDVREVRDGYALNYLLPKKLAALPGKVNIDKIKNLNKHLKSKKVLSIDRKEILDKLKNLFLEVYAESNDQGRLYASVDKDIIAKALERKGIKITVHSMQPVHLKEVGEQFVKLTFEQGLSADVKVIIKKK